MNKFSKLTLAASALVFSGLALASSNTNASTQPEAQQDPMIQHLHLNSSQVDKIKALRAETDKKMASIDTKDIQNGLLINIIDSGKWDETAVKKQIAAFGKAQEQARYYRMQYFFNLSKILTPEQKAQVKSDLAQEMEQQQ
ncbi:Spy/CpxP family protein refolding chaperone [Hafnia alvei]|uniref:Spy/CpxP family protein refolding chaperone n=1 Tax=Hafnia alvei TaxID=569 RepID=UPI00345D82FF